MILLYPRGGRTHIVFIRRTSNVLHHKDQIGFPGGQIEAGEDYVLAALRETREEIGVPGKAITVVGSLTPLYIQPSDFCVYPVVGASDEPGTFRPEPTEVAEIIEAPLDHLKNPIHLRTETWKLGDVDVRIPFYECGPHKIWGATAMVLAEFLAVLGAS